MLEQDTPPHKNIFPLSVCRTIIANLRCMYLQPIPHISPEKFPLVGIWLTTKGQLISKWFFGVVDFLQKTNENKST